MQSETQGTLFEDQPTKTRWLSLGCGVRIEGDEVTVLVANSPLFAYHVSDLASARVAATLLANADVAPLGKIQKVFGIDDVTLYRLRAKLSAGGVAAVVACRRGRPQGSVLVKLSLAKRAAHLLARGLPRKDVAARLNISLRGLGRLVGPATEGAEDGSRQETLPLQADTTESGDNEPVAPISAAVVAAGGEQEPTAGVVDETNTRTVPVPPIAASIDDVLAVVAPAEPLGHVVPGVSVSRAPTQQMAVLYAMLGMSLDGEAEVVFESAKALPSAGLLLAVPALCATGLFDVVRKVYGRLRNGIYGLRATVMTIAALTFQRRPHPEALKDKEPHCLGDVLGLARVPEVKTLRRKLTEVAKTCKAHLFWRELARDWLQECKDKLGVLYVDGHVRVYHGDHTLPKAHVTQRNLSMPATTDYWVNDVNGDPVFLVTAPANAAMTQMLPRLLAEVENLWKGRVGTVVFDRGGWSPKLFAQLMAIGWDILTYRKGKRRKHAKKKFHRRTARIDERRVTYWLSERTTRLKNGLRLREIAKLRPNGDQTILVTSNFKSSSVLLAYRLFERWRQENYFRYAKKNFDLDALIDYAAEADNPEREVPNPAYKALSAKLTAARAKQAELERSLGAEVTKNEESQRRTVRGLKIATGTSIGKPLAAARKKAEELEARRRGLPKRVPVGEVVGDDEVVRLAPERKLFTAAIRAAVYRSETALLVLLRQHFRRADDEGRNFLRQAMEHPADLTVDDNDVLVAFGPMSAPRYTAALRDLCHDLNELAPRYPETTYRLRYEVRAEGDA